jgi:hypothetical protein
MLRVLVEIVVLVNGLAVLVGYGLRRIRRQRYERNIDAIKRLELENREIDDSLERMTTPQPRSLRERLRGQ